MRFATIVRKRGGDMDNMIFQIFVFILGVLFVIACIIGVFALYFMLKGWAWHEFEIELPPRAKAKESHWETLEDSVTPTYVCNKCNGESDRKSAYCPNCGIGMRNYDKRNYNRRG